MRKYLIKKYACPQCFDIDFKFSAKICASISVSNSKLQGGSLPNLAFPESMIVTCTDDYLTSDGGCYYEATCSVDGTWTLSDNCTYQGIWERKAAG